MINAFRITRPQIAQDLLEQQRPQRLTRRRDQDREQRVQQLCRIDDLFSAEEHETPDYLFPELGLEGGVVEGEDCFEI